MERQHLSQTKKAIAPSQSQTNASDRSSAHPVEELQGAIGNRAVNKLLANQPTVQAKPMFGGLSRELVIQPKLTIGAVGDKYEQEADRVAANVVDQIHTPQSQVIQREEMPEEDEELQMQPTIQRLAIQRRGETIAVGEASTDLDTAINSVRRSGQPLDANLQQSMGQALGADFSRVKVHTDAQSDQLNRSIQAKAFTTGQDVFFRQGAYQPGSRGGQELIAHELTHVVQQNGRAVQRSPQQHEQLQKHSARETASASIFDHSLFSNIRCQNLFYSAPETGIIQRVIHIQKGNRDIDRDTAMRELIPFLRFTEIGDRLQEVDNVVNEFHQDNKTFDDIIDFAVQVDYRVKDILIDEDLAEVIDHDDFQRMVTESKIPALKQQQLASEINAEAKTMNDVYEKLSYHAQERKHSPETILKWFTQKTKEFAIRVMKIATKYFGLPTAPLSVMIAGSGAREEMFPGSDLDLAAVTETTTQDEIEGVFSFMQKVEKILKLTVKQLSKVAGKGGEIGLGPDTGVFGFKGTPEELADKSLKMQNTGQDATGLVSTKKADKKSITERFFTTRSKLGDENHGLANLIEILNEFQLPEGVKGVMNIKTQFLRLPTLALRDLSQVFALKSTNSFDRIREIVEIGYLKADFGKALISALNHISGIRLQLHIHYGSEKDTFAVDEISKTSLDQYVLTSKEKDGLDQALKILREFYKHLTEFVPRRQKRNFFTSKSIY